MRHQKRFGIICKGYSHNQILQIVSIKEWHTSSLLEEYEYLRVLFCYDRSLGSIGSYRIGRIKGMWCLYWTVFNSTSQWFRRT